MSDMCQCGHVLYSHYMCGIPQESRCLVCYPTCKQFKPRQWKVKEATVIMFLLLALATPAQAKPKHRILDWKFWLATGVVVVATSMDIESTQAVFRRCPTCVEGNLIHGRPGRAKLYSIDLSIDAGYMTLAYFFKKRGDGLQKMWLLPPAIPVGAHLYGFAHNQGVCSGAARLQYPCKH